MREPDEAGVATNLHDLRTWTAGSKRVHSPRYYSKSIRGVYSLVATARANGLEPSAYLNFLFENLPAAETVEALEALLPWNVRSSLPATRRAA